MWHESNSGLGRTALSAVLAVFLASGCTPDAPEGGLPTHPSDTYSVTLEWDAPTTDAVGRPLEDLAGYHLYYTDTGSMPEASAEMIEIGDTTRVTVEGLAEGEYLFAVTALDMDGNESEFSDPLPVEVGR